jgi:hypothetical protein
VCVLLQVPTERAPSCCEYLKEFASCCKTYATSWSGQTAISGVNHLLAIAFFSYGLLEFGPGSKYDVLSAELEKFLWSGITLTVIGVFTSATSYFQRRWPQCKYTPTDDSFRLACVLKALLVMNKALIVYELSKIDLAATPGLQTWTMCEKQPSKCDAIFFSGKHRSHLPNTLRTNRETSTQQHNAIVRAFCMQVGDCGVCALSVHPRPAHLCI